MPKWSASISAVIADLFPIVNVAMQIPQIIAIFQKNGFVPPEIPPEQVAKIVAGYQAKLDGGYPAFMTQEEIDALLAEE